MKKLSVLTLVALIAAGCSHQRLQINESSPTPTIANFEGTNHFIFWGIGQTKTVDPNEVCGPRGVHTVQTSQGFLNGFLYVITYGIYAPRTFTVYCNPMRAATVVVIEE
ncbi:MAG: Bor family protein [Alphaproteobacteria bacterium]|nr:Bor family protein [Alphaproteobacteria bacterium]